jgi:hypothetical protein
MKIIRIITLIALVIVFSGGLFSQVGIGTITPHASAELDLTSTTEGFLPPRMTQAQRNAIATPVAAGLQVWCLDCGTYGEAQVFNGTIWTNMIGGAAAVFTCGTLNVTFTYNGASVTYGTVSRAYGGTVGTKCWLDRNLGATQVATNTNQTSSYGHLFQWGRGADGHQTIVWTSSSASDGSEQNNETVTLSTTDVPGNANFILAPTTPYDWRIGQNGNLWQGVSGTNNPCPSGFRLPTELEWDSERLSWVQAPISSTNNSTGAFASPLKLPMAGSRALSNGVLSTVGTRGLYWGSTVIISNSRGLYFDSGTAYILTGYRGDGFLVRCLKE